MSLFRMYWQRTLRRPGSIVLWLAIPFVFMTIYTLVFGGDGAPPRTGIALVDQDSSFVSGLVAGAFTQGPVGDLMTVVEAADTTEAELLFAAGDASAALVLPKGFGERLLRQEPQQLVLYRNPRHVIGPQIAEGVTEALVTIANGTLDEFGAPLRAVRGAIDSSQTPSRDELADISLMFMDAGRGGGGLLAVRTVDVAIVTDEGDEPAGGFNLAALFFPGLVMFGLLSVSLHIENRFLMDRVNHVTDRFIMAPVTPWRLAIEQRLYAASFVYVMGVGAAVLGGLVWHIEARGLGVANLITVALALFVAGFNGLIFSLSNSKRAISAISSLAMVFLTLLGGGFYPAEFSPAGLQSLARVLPTGMANLGLTHALTGRELPISLPLLFASSLAFFVAGIGMGRRAISRRTA